MTLQLFLFAMLGFAETGSDVDVYDDLIHSDVPLWGYDSPDVWPKHLGGDEIGCAYNMKMGDWKYKKTDEYDMWFRLQNYGVFHCYFVVAEAIELEDLVANSARYSYLIDLGEVNHNVGKTRLWALQIGGRPGSDYILLSSNYAGDGLIVSFNVLQRQCPKKNVRQGPSLDILLTRYCAINSQKELVQLAKAMYKLPPLAVLNFQENIAD